MVVMAGKPSGMAATARLTANDSATTTGADTHAAGKMRFHAVIAETWSR